MLKTIWNLNPSRDWVSRRASLGHNVWLVLETVLISGVLTALWAMCYKSKWPFHVHHEPDLIMVSTAILVCAAIFAFVAATLFAQVRQKNINLARALLLKDEVEFMVNRDEKVQIMMHVVVSFFGLAVLVLSAVVAYTELWIGATIIFLESSCIVVYFIAMFEMQDVRNAVWIRRHAPERWLTQNTIDFFEKRNEQSEQKRAA